MWGTVTSTKSRGLGHDTEGDIALVGKEGWEGGVAKKGKPWKRQVSFPAGMLAVGPSLWHFCSLP